MEDLSLFEFALRLMVALVLGASIGVERSLRRRMAGLKTNTLVAIGAAIFVMYSIMVTGESSPTRVAAQIVSGIGFLGAGVILRDGWNIRGLTTAATLWCSAAIGILCGSGNYLYAAFATIVIVSANVLFSKIEARFHLNIKGELVLSKKYRIHLSFFAEHKEAVKRLLIQVIESKGLYFKSIQNEADDHEELETFVADVLTGKDSQKLLSKVTSQLISSPKVARAYWQEEDLQD